MDINAIIDMAKGTMLDLGKHLPTVYVEFRDDPELQYCVLADFMTISKTYEKEKALFSAGASFGQAKRDKEITSLCFVCEAWQSSYKTEEQVRNAPRPSKDPNRKEVLIVLMLDMGTSPIRQFGHIVEIVRTGGGIDLLDRGEHDEMQTNFLVAFSAGFRSVKSSPQELYQFVASVTPGQSRQVRRAMLRDLQKLQGRAQLMDIDEYKAYRGR